LSEITTGLMDQVVYLKALVPDKFSSSYHFYQKGNLELALGKFDEAVRFFELALLLDKNFLEPRIDLGAALLCKHEFAQAITEFNILLNIKSDCGVAYYNRGVAYYVLGNNEMATRNWQLAIKYGINEAENCLKRIRA